MQVRFYARANPSGQYPNPRVSEPGLEPTSHPRWAAEVVKGEDEHAIGLAIGLVLECTVDQESAPLRVGLPPGRGRFGNFPDDGPGLENVCSFSTSIGHAW